MFLDSQSSGVARNERPSFGGVGVRGEAGGQLRCRESWVKMVLRV